VDEGARRFTTLYDTHYQRVLRYALAFSPPDVAQDVVAESYLIAWRKLGDAPRSSELPWLLGIARNARLKLRDQDQRHIGLTDRIKAMTVPQDQYT
jgi:DNA-directed RNA polymerase specialized sigma24 family protein